MRLALTWLLFISFNISAFAQQFTVSGKVIDDVGKPVPFASVYIQNTTQGASANSEGEYAINLKPGKYVLQYKAVGYMHTDQPVLQSLRCLSLTRVRRHRYR
ncbi:carboxypeptidase-like regulatory domain-containing protein [Mucilaginibacter sp. S1162]|uniref:Carboxypeptidase-like regulatory domain-containing protein n=1 Tax=Mucilaginibacter humi TaxID=2732510 RepID=A0ABX1W3I6_9SPHI|nr:carboxypeptidase-like regulatory domain-containing protein [Mucilaginibacter humi]NNU34553.1 carboxypeptidase-like regulatory domain-containing protein [Mucilaginibacter humi]